VSLAEYRYRFTTPWKKYAVILLCLLPVWKVYAITVKSWKYYSAVEHNRQTQRLFMVTKFSQQNDTIPASINDTMRWKYAIFFDYSPRSRTLITYDMQEKSKSYRYSWDTVKRMLLVFDKKDTLHKNSFTYTGSVIGNLELKGVWQGKSTTMELKHMPVDSLILVKDKFLFMQEDQ